MELALQFFCSAGAKEALRRTTQSDVGSCIKAIDKHFAMASDGAHVERIKKELQEGVTNLVDERLRDKARAVISTVVMSDEEAEEKTPQAQNKALLDIAEVDTSTNL